MAQDQKNTTEQIIRRAEEILQTARHGLEDLQTQKGSRRFSGLRNLVVFGRSVTFVLQNLRSVENDFDTWYAPIQDKLKEDEVMKYFVELRNQILKQGRLNTAISVNASFSSEDIKKLGTPPPGAKGFFIGDQFGGSGWAIELPDGSEAKYYVELPKSIADVKQVFTDVPDAAREAVGGRSVEELGRLYLDTLESILDSCRNHFLGSTPQTMNGKRLPPYIRVVK